MLFGHAAAEAALLAAYRSGRMPHALLIGGPKGIGKATLAYRLARFVLAHPDPAAPEVQAATSLAVDPAHPVARRIAAQAQPDLLVLERTLNDKGVLRQQIAVDDVRRTVSFFGSTAGRAAGASPSSTRSTSSTVRRQCAAQGAGGAAAARAVAAGQPFRRRGCWRRCARAAASSRCGRLAQADVAAALAAATGSAADDAEIVAAAAAADGSVARALAFLDEDALALRQQALDLLDALPALDPARSMRSATRIAGTDPQPLAAFSTPSMPGCRTALIATRTRSAGWRGLAEASERINAAARDAETYNLERKPLVFSVFGLLAEATRG